MYCVPEYEGWMLCATSTCYAIIVSSRMGCHTQRRDRHRPMQNATAVASGIRGLLGCVIQVFTLYFKFGPVKNSCWALSASVVSIFLQSVARFIYTTRCNALSRSRRLVFFFPFAKRRFRMRRFVIYRPVFLCSFIMNDVKNNINVKITVVIIIIIIMKNKLW